MKHKRLLMILMTMVGIAALGGAAFVVAEPPAPEVSSATLYREPQPAGLSEMPVAGAMPDEDGYAGPVVEAQIEGGEASGEGGAAAPVDWEAFFTEPQPDEDAGVAADDVSIHAWSNFYYLNVTGTALRPRDSTVTWDNDGTGGCLYQTGGSTLEIFNIHLHIPPGSRIDYLRLYYYDTSSNTSIAWVTTYDNEGGVDDLITVSSSGSGGYGTMLSPYLGHVVDYASDSYVLNWRSNQTGNSMRLCGLRVAYRLPN